MDYYSNRNLKKEERTFSLVKTIMKIVVGAGMGVSIRYMGEKYGTKLFEQKIVPKVKNGIDKFVKKLPNYREGEDTKFFLNKYLKDKASAFEQFYTEVKTTNRSNYISKCKEYINKNFTDVLSQSHIKKIFSRLDNHELKYDPYFNLESLGQKEKIPIWTKITEDVKNDVGISELFVRKYLKKEENKEYFDEIPKAFGDALGVVATAIFTVSLDARLINNSINFIMKKIYPDYGKEGKLNA